MSICTLCILQIILVSNCVSKPNITGKDGERTVDEKMTGIVITGQAHTHEKEGETFFTKLIAVDQKPNPSNSFGLATCQPM
jgi:hypothetical protein